MRTISTRECKAWDLSKWKDTPYCGQMTTFKDTKIHTHCSTSCNCEILEATYVYTYESDWINHHTFQLCNCGGKKNEDNLYDMEWLPGHTVVPP
jgi:hypothetical protein